MYVYIYLIYIYRERERVRERERERTFISVFCLITFFKTYQIYTTWISKKMKEHQMNMTTQYEALKTCKKIRETYIKNYWKYELQKKKKGRKDMNK